MFGCCLFNEYYFTSGYCPIEALNVTVQLVLTPLIVTNPANTPFLGNFAASSYSFSPNILAAFSRAIVKQRLTLLPLTDNTASSEQKTLQKISEPEKQAVIIRKTKCTDQRAVV